MSNEFNDPILLAEFIMTLKPSEQTQCFERNTKIRDKAFRNKVRARSREILEERKKHRDQNMHSHSLEAYKIECSKLEGRKKDVHAWLKLNGASTDREVMAGLGHSDMNTVRPRITEMIEFGVLAETGETACPVTNRTVRIVNVV